MTILASPGANQVVPGVLGFLVVAGMSVVLFFLLRSMNKQLRKVIPEQQWRERAQKTRLGSQPHNGAAPRGGPGQR